MPQGNSDYKTDAKELKRQVALRAAELVSDHMIVGLGSGSTLEIFIRELGSRIRRENLNITGTPTSLQARLVAKDAGIPILDPIETDDIDLTVDGADEVDPQGNVIKGAGAAHVLEKIIAAKAKRFVIIVDESKLVTTLGEKFAVPIEVVAPALPLALKELARLGAEPVIRVSGGKAGPVISEFGHVIVDARFGPIADPAKLDAQLNAIPGLVGHGLFIGMVHEVIVARSTPQGPALEILKFK